MGSNGIDSRSPPVVEEAVCQPLYHHLSVVGWDRHCQDRREEESDLGLGSLAPIPVSGLSGSVALGMKLRSSWLPVLHQ